MGVDRRRMVGDEENRIREAIVIKDEDKSCGLSCFPPAGVSQFFQGSLQVRC